MHSVPLASRVPVAWSETFGLRPLGPALRQSWLAFRGDEHTPPSQFDRSSLAIFWPRIAFPLWRGRVRDDRRLWVTCLPNREPIPPEEGYSVRVTSCRDFRGGRLTYDSHVGTDYATPPGTRICAAAPGIVRQVRMDMQRGGLKVVVDHGAGLITMHSHLARTGVRPGQRLARGEVLGLSGMSSVDGVLSFPWLAPHLHQNVLLGGVVVDPFAREGEESLWNERNAPVPHGGGVDGQVPATEWDAEALEEAIVDCRDPRVRETLAAVADPEERAVAVVVERVLRGFAFPDPGRPLAEGARRPRLDLPFHREDYAGIAFADEG